MRDKHAAIHTMHMHACSYKYISHIIIHSNVIYGSMCVVACMSDCVTRLEMPRIHVA